jgi:hypothetical protein
VWLTSVALDHLLRRLILVTYASSQWRGKKFLIEHVVNVKTLNGSFSFLNCRLALQKCWKTASDFPFSLKIKWKTVRFLLKFCKNQEFFPKKLCHMCTESKELMLTLVWSKHTNIVFIFSLLFFRYSNMITFLLQNW